MLPNQMLKYSKIELLIKNKNNGTTLIDFENCYVNFLNNFLVIVTETNDSQTGRLYNLNEIHSYKTII